MTGYGNAITNGELTKNMQGMKEHEMKTKLGNIKKREYPILPDDKQEIFTKMCLKQQRDEE